MKTMEVYFYIPEKRSTILLEVDINNYSEEKMRENISKMMRAEALSIDVHTYRKLVKN